MVAKGLDFARVTLVGVISAETQLYLPDFRATERTFQLLTQVAGRAGRGHLIGEVVIQTVNPRHATLLHAVKHDFGAFYDEELTIRKEVHYPPYVRIALVECSGKDEGAVERRAAEIAQKLNSAKMSESIRVLGPAEPAIPKLRNQYRRHILLKSDRLKDPSALALRSALEPLLMEKRRTTERGNEVKLTIDVDPQSFL
jgi:primosomal protein N' (replication factor Y)